jgi:hypothetical protein
MDGPVASAALTGLLEKNNGTLLGLIALYAYIFPGGID